MHEVLHHSGVATSNRFHQSLFYTFIFLMAVVVGLLMVWEHGFLLDQNPC
jgi:hypothetical protein